MDKIYIPTLGRHDNQITFNHLPQKWKNITVMVIQEKEKHLYDYDCEYHVVDNDIGIAKTRELIYRLAGKKRYMIIDDDITFKRRNRRYYGLESNMEKSKRDFIDSDYDDIIQSFEQKHDEGIILCGTRLEYMPPAQEASSNVGGGVYNAYSIDGQIFSEFIDEIDFSYTSNPHCTVEDILINMEILSRGYKIGKFDEFLYSTDFGSDGGCSTFRTVDEVKGGLQMIKNRFPNYIETLDKEENYNDLNNHLKSVKNEIVNGQPKVRIFWSKLMNDLPNLKDRPTLEDFFG